MSERVLGSERIDKGRPFQIEGPTTRCGLSPWHSINKASFYLSLIILYLFNFPIHILLWHFQFDIGFNNNYTTTKNFNKHKHLIKQTLASQSMLHKWLINSPGCYRLQCVRRQCRVKQIAGNTDSEDQLTLMFSGSREYSQSIGWQK